MTCIYLSRGQRGVVHNHETMTQKPPRRKFEEYAVTLQEGEELNTMYLLAPSLEDAAWSALELSMDRNAILKNVIRAHEW